jgi:ADP-ribose pyrophosphatase YjhB (NUDIX family)
MIDPRQASGPRWLALAQRLQAMAQTGLAFAADHYNQERYTAIREVAFEMMATGFGAGRSEVAAAFASEAGYATPKVDVRAAVFRNDGKILLVRERADSLWSLPGGWLDVGESPREAAAREVREESGYAVTTGRLLAVLDKGKHPHPPQPFVVLKIFIECAIAHDEPLATDGVEVSESGFFGAGALPPLSLDRVLPEQVDLMFRLHADPDAPAVVD